MANSKSKNLDLAIWEKAPEFKLKLHGPQEAHPGSTAAGRTHQNAFAYKQMAKLSISLLFCYLKLKEI